jgi:UDP-N-acetyl-D-glucosamine dehydrogenase
VFGLESAPLTAETLRRYDCVLIVTDHKAYDYDFIAKESWRVVDTRNATSSARGNQKKIVGRQVMRKQYINYNYLAPWI